MHLDDAAGAIVSVAPEHFGPVSAGSPLPLPPEIARTMVPGPDADSVELAAQGV